MTIRYIPKGKKKSNKRAKKKRKKGTIFSTHFIDFCQVNKYKQNTLYVQTQSFRKVSLCQLIRTMFKVMAYIQIT